MFLAARECGAVGGVGVVMGCARRIVSLRKTGAMMRFCDHGSAAGLYKSGNCRGICVEIVLDFSLGAIGFLVNGAQRARAAEIWVLAYCSGAGVGSSNLNRLPKGSINSMHLERWNVSSIPGRR